MLNQIIKVVLGFFADYVKMWYDGEKKAEAEWNAKTREGQLRSVIDADKIEVAISTVKPVVPATPSGWNAGRAVSVLVLGLLLVSLSGCTLFTRYVYVADKKPVIDLPDRPVLSDDPPFTEREKKLVTYAVDIESKTRTYNEWAHEQNRTNGYEERDVTE